jgi:hypothetical protein
MANPILDDSSDYWKTKIYVDKVISGFIIFIGMLLIYNSINNWYSFSQNKELIIALAWNREPEMVYPIRILASILTCVHGLRLFLGEIKIKTAIVLSILTLGGIDLWILLFL